MDCSFEDWCLTHSPSLLSEWHPTKNLPLQPSEIKPRSNRKVWWLGKCGHEWNAVVGSRLNGNSCPYCANRKVLKGFNDLSTLNPKLAKEWHPTKNKSLQPDQLTSGSSKKVWWLGKCGHEWEAAICNRNSGRGCPVCRGLVICEGVNDLATMNPELALEWHPTKNGELKPIDVAPYSNKKVWWLGKCGHEWEAFINNRSKGVGCPYCSNVKTLPGFNDLQTVHPEIAKEYHPSKNQKKVYEISACNDRYVWWLGKCGHEWTDSVYHRVERGDGCPYCSGRRVIPDKTSLLAKNPELAKLWDYNKNAKRPDEVSTGSREKFYWNCKCGHERYTTISSMMNNQCPICTREMRTSFQEKAVAFYIEQIPPLHNRVVENYHPDFLKRGELDIYIPDLQIAIEYDGRRGHTETKLPSDINKNKLCEKHSIQLIRIRESECPPISGYVISVENKNDSDLEKAINLIIDELCKRYSIENTVVVDLEADSGKIQEKQYSSFKEKSLKALFPTIAEELHPTKNGNLDPNYIPAYGNRKIWWLGRCGHEWEAAPNTRSRGDGCPYCAGVRLLIGFNDFETNNPDLATEWHPVKNIKKPSEYTKCSGRKVWWLGKCGHEWEAAINHRVFGENCPYCLGTGGVLPGFNDLMTIAPELASEWHPTKNSKKPSEIRPQSNKKVWWLGKCGHEWEATVTHRYSRKDGCPYCSNKRVLKGFNDLETTDPQVAAHWHPTKNGLLKPYDVSRGSGKRVWWIDSNGNEFEGAVHKIVKKINI